MHICCNWSWQNLLLFTKIDFDTPVVLISKSTSLLFHKEQNAFLAHFIFHLLEMNKTSHQHVGSKQQVFLSHQSKWLKVWMVKSYSDQKSELCLQTVPTLLIKTDVPAVIVQCQSSNYACLTVVWIMILSRHYLMVLFFSSEDRL